MTLTANRSILAPSLFSIIPTFDFISFILAAVWILSKAAFSSNDVTFSSSFLGFHFTHKSWIGNHFLSAEEKQKPSLVIFLFIEESIDEASSPFLLDWIKSDRPERIYQLACLSTDDTVILKNSPVNSMFTAPTLFVASFSSFDLFSRTSTRSVIVVIFMSRYVTSDLFPFF